MTEQIESAKILILENEPKWIQIIRKHLSATSYQFADASTVDEARLLLKSQPYDLIIADLELSSEEHIYADLGRLIFAIEHDHLHGVLRPQIIVVTGYPIDEKVLNEHGGWIWGWHEKSQIHAGSELRRNVAKALETRNSLIQSIQKPFKSDHTEISLDLGNKTIGDILSMIKPQQLYAVGAVLLSLLVGVASVAYLIGTIAGKP